MFGPCGFLAHTVTKALMAFMEMKGKTAAT
jgi:hypothetical protein